MPKDLGDPVGPGHHNERLAGDGTASAGDALAIDQSDGKLKQGDTDTADISEFAGIAEDDFGSDGDGESLVTEAPTGVVANVASGVSGGERLGLGNATNSTVGQLESSSGGPVLALCDEGGTYKGHSLDANEAVVVF